MLAATALCLAVLAQPAPGPPEALLGTVVEKATGRPLAGVSIRGADDPNAQTATSDEQGRFDRNSIMRGNWVPARGQGPTCWVRAEDDRSLPWEFVASEGPGGAAGADFHRRQAAHAIYQQCQSRWQGGTLIVECPPISEIEAILRGPDGVPLKDAPILLVPTADVSFPGSGTLRLPRRTDRDGVFRLRTFDGVQRFSVQVPGVGFGSTGVVHMTEGRIARPQIAPLARFARIEGRVDSKLLAPGAKVALLSMPFQTSIGPASPCDDQGRFTLVDVVPGNYRLTVLKGGQSTTTGYREIQAQPGATLRDVVVEPPPPPSADAQRVNQQLIRRLNGDRNKTVAWVEGTIRDEQGRPLPKAVVYVHAQYDGGIRMNEDVKKATTDDQGRYKIEGPLQPSMGILAVIASAKGRPPTTAYAVAPDAALDDGDRKPARLDVSLPAAGASARITILEDGKKVPGATVQLTVTDATAGRRRIFGPGVVQSPDRIEMEDLISRTIKTGPDGVARFENLPPGPFEVVALPNVEPTDPFTKGRPPTLGVAPGFTQTITVPPSGVVETSINVGRKLKPVRFQLLKPDGTPVAARTISFSFGQGNVASSTAIRCDDRGFVSYQFQSPGLWMVDVRFRDDEVRRFPIQEEPYYQVQTLLPVSRELELEDPIVLKAERREPGSIRARLLDAEGRPASGTVLVLGSFPQQNQPIQAGTVDAEGSVCFLDVPSGKYRIQGVVDGRPTAPKLVQGDPFPDDAVLQGVQTVFDRELTVTAGGAATVELRLQPVGYVRATLKPPAGRTAAEYYAFVNSKIPGDLTGRTQIDPAAGAYLFGPLPVGPLTIGLFERLTNRPADKRGERAVVVEPDKLVHVDLEPEPSSPQPAAPIQPPRVYPGIGGAREMGSVLGGLEATILMPDGTTPAYGARADYYPAGGRQAVAQGIADASGRLTWTGAWRTPTPISEKAPPPLNEPTIAAWLPGLSGPVVGTCQSGKPLVLVLPSASGASGIATIGGRGVEGRGGRIRIIAEAQDRGSLADAFSREVVAEPDGRFRLPELGPGKYLVQAVRDEIWLSKAIPLVVESGKEAGPVEVDIPEPGATVALEVVDGRDHPVPGLSLSIVRPEGPLAPSLPISFRVDERGTVTLRGLETGRQTLLIDGGPKPNGFIVDPARPSVSRQLIRLEVPRPGP
ncbi:carboxypeptidase-like regulatory domain-containing protein [Paludisphaera rhizosphaerae]|uniref:carboxypeptidase-like regulatory domain-containing protein n=1 Tax=Paludisphaera rhizosphaerae TaxID=2711216 RepID=UPI0013EBFE04|nr:carboxypeptidase-like regulatory domain-containing protein [Paludisphaera rhizosphaerae]